MADARGRLGAERIDLAGGQFAVGDRVVLKLNDRHIRVENGNRGTVVRVDDRAGTLDIRLTGDRIVALPRRYLQRKTAIGDPTMLHGYAGTAHIAQGITTGRAFVLGSDIAYREWGYVAWSRARLQTHFYVCEPDLDPIAEEHHTAAEPQRDVLEDIVGALERSQAQYAAFEHVDHVAKDVVNGVDDARTVGSEHANGSSHRDRRAAVAHDATLAKARFPGGHATGTPVPGAQTGEPTSPQILAARRDPPPYLLGELGERPLHPARVAAWDRAANLIERYRNEQVVVSSDDAFGPRPPDLRGQVAWRNARRDVERARGELTGRESSRAVGRGL